MAAHWDKWQFVSKCEEGHRKITKHMGKHENRGNQNPMVPKSSKIQWLMNMFINAMAAFWGSEFPQVSDTSKWSTCASEALKNHRIWQFLVLNCPFFLRLSLLGPEFCIIYKSLISNMAMEHFPIQIHVPQGQLFVKYKI